MFDVVESFGIARFGGWGRCTIAKGLFGPGRRILGGVHLENLFQKGRLRRDVVDGSKFGGAGELLLTQKDIANVGGGQGYCSAAYHVNIGGRRARANDAQLESQQDSHCESEHQQIPIVSYGRASRTARLTAGHPRVLYARALLNYRQGFDLSTHWAFKAMFVSVALLLSVCTLAEPEVLGALPQKWRDDGGGNFDLTMLRGRPLVFAMAYASCRRVCPMTMESLRKVQAALDGRGIAADIVIIGYDPADDPATWRRYRQSHRLNYPNWHFLSGNDAAVRQFARLLGFDFWKYDEHVMHDFRIVFVAPDGRVVDGLSWSNRNQDLLAGSGPACHFLNPSGSCP